jgi:cholesterol transport system auxiliary component
MQPRISTLWMGLLLTVAAFFLGCGSNPVWRQQTFALSVSGEAKPGPVATNTLALARVTVSPSFQSRSFTYRTEENTYEHDPYASFVASPEHTLAEAIRAGLRNDGVFGHIVEPGSGLTPSVLVEASVLKWDGDFRDAAHPVAELEIHFVIYQAGPDGPGRVLLDKTSAVRTPLAQRTPTALVAGWDQDLREIMGQISAEYRRLE